MDVYTQLGRYKQIAEILQQAYGVERAMLVQAVVISEEAGEVSKAMRSFMGYSRNPVPGLLSAVAEELADVVIAANVAADMYAIDLHRAVLDKLLKIEERGGK